MSKKKLYFENIDSSNAYPESVFQEQMKDEGLTEMEVIVAIPIPESKEEFVFCTNTDKCYEKSECGTHCSAYKAKSNKNHKCIYKGKYCDFGETVILKL